MYRVLSAVLMLFSSFAPLSAETQPKIKELILTGTQSVGRFQEPCCDGALLAVLQTDQTGNTSQAKDETTPTRQGGSVVPPKLIHSVVPVYPAWAKRRGIQSRVRFSAILGKDGKLRDIKLVSGDPALVKSATQAVLKWRYEPCLLNGKPTEVRIETVVDFGLKKVSH